MKFPLQKKSKRIKILLLEKLTAIFSSLHCVHTPKKKSQMFEDMGERGRREVKKMPRVRRENVPPRKRKEKKKTLLLLRSKNGKKSKGKRNNYTWPILKSATGCGNEERECGGGREGV